jgi:hypothetical protein
MVHGSACGAASFRSPFGGALQVVLCTGLQAAPHEEG